jgi:hypothetical protein
MEVHKMNNVAKQAQRWLEEKLNERSSTKLNYGSGKMINEEKLATRNQRQALSDIEDAIHNFLPDALEGLENWLINIADEDERWDEGQYQNLMVAIRTEMLKGAAKALKGNY